LTKPTKENKLKPWSDPERLFGAHTKKDNQQ
jgi:hypothetical protein